MVLKFFLKYGLPLSVFTDLFASIDTGGTAKLIGQIVRGALLILFLIESIRHYKLTLNFSINRYTFLFALILFVYVFTDKNIIEGLWLFSKTLFWVLGINVINILLRTKRITPKLVEKILTACILVASVFTIYVVGFLTDFDYNLTAYAVLFMYPALLYFSYGYKRKRVILLLASIAIVLTLKRGAVLGILVANIIYLLYIGFRIRNYKKIISALIIIAIGLFLGVSIFKSQIDYQQRRFEYNQFDLSNKQAGSGRVGLYESLYLAWLNADFEEFILGHGNQADTRRDIYKGVHSHSDIFGYLYNYGIVGIFLILTIYFGLFRYYRNNIHLNKDSKSAIVISIVILILVNIYSGLFRNQDALYLFLVFPLVDYEKIRQ